MTTKFLPLSTLASGLAMFCMFFGAGNVIFPLAIGQQAGDQAWLAACGLLITAVLMPFAGLLAIFLCEGDYERFFNRLGKIPGLLVALLVISLLGPLGSTPRCIALSYTAFKTSFTDVSPILFGAISCFLIFGFAYKKNRIIDHLGYVLTPLLLLSLGYIVVKGLMTPAEAIPSGLSNSTAFLLGVKEGYNTMDLLAAFFFSPMIIASLRNRVSEGTVMGHAIRAGLIGAFLLAITYVGFSLIASMHGHDLGISGKEEILGAIVMKVMGPSAGSLVCLTIILACLTTAIALISAFTDFIQRVLLKGAISYEVCLALSLAMTFVMSTFEFSGISSFLGPILEVCYPGLIALTAINIFYSLKSEPKPTCVPEES